MLGAVFGAFVPRRIPWRDRDVRGARGRCEKTRRCQDQEERTHRHPAIRIAHRFLARQRFTDDMQTRESRMTGETYVRNMTKPRALSRAGLCAVFVMAGFEKRSL